MLSLVAISEFGNRSNNRNHQQNEAEHYIVLDYHQPIHMPK